MMIYFKITTIAAILLLGILAPAVLCSHLAEPLPPPSYHLTPLTYKIIDGFCREHGVKINPDATGSVFVSAVTGEPEPDTIMFLAGDANVSSCGAARECNP